MTVAVNPKASLQKGGSGTSSLANLGSLTANTALDVAAASLILFTVGAALTLSFSNPPADGSWTRVVLRITNGAAFALTWPAGINWAGGSPPALSASGVDEVALVIFNIGDAITIDGAFVGKVA